MDNDPSITPFTALIMDPLFHLQYFLFTPEHVGIAFRIFNIYVYCIFIERQMEK